ncbi:Uncharacterised protein [Klebsiella grimontii]|nr:Uncharacterised protein [Klebsiella grimontii]
MLFWLGLVEQTMLMVPPLRLLVGLIHWLRTLIQ